MHSEAVAKTSDRQRRTERWQGPPAADDGSLFWRLMSDDDYISIGIANIPVSVRLSER